MKKLSFLFAIVTLIGTLLLSSCTKDTTPPTIQFLGGAGYTSTDVTIPANSAIKVGITAQSGSSKLVNLTVISTSNNIPSTLKDTTFSSDTFNKDFTITAPDAVGTARITFKITDKDGASAEVSFNVTTTEVNPTINFTGGAGFILGDVTLKVGEVIKVGISAFSNSKSKAKLKTFKVVRTFNNMPFTALDSTLNSTDAFNIILESYTYPAVGVENWTFTITDQDGASTKISFNVTTTPGGGPINEYSQKILGSYDNSAYGSSFASADGTVYSLADAKANAAKIDWMYYYGSTAFATLSSPSDASASSVFSGTNGPANWSVRNDTKLGKVTLPTGLTWASITTDAEIVILASEASDSKVTALTVGQIAAFKTVTGKLGLIKVEAITGTGAGTITYSVKVQK